MTDANPSYAIEGQEILTDESECVVRYIYDETDPNVYPSDFVEAFALLMAARMAASITGNLELGMAFEQKAFREVIPRAGSSNANDSRGQRCNWIWESDLVLTRLNG